MTNAAHISNQNWFHIRYESSAPAGLPPLIQAERVMRYRDETGTWLVALWEPAADADSVAACILRVPADQVMDVTQHHDMGEAASHMSSARTDPSG